MMFDCPTNTSIKAKNGSNTHSQRYELQAVVETDIPSQSVKVSTQLDNQKISAVVVDAGYDVLSIA